MIIVGSVLGYSLIFLYIGQLSTAICMSQVWLGGVAFALAVGNLIGKNWRIYKIFNTRGKTQAVKDHHVLMVTFGILFIELAIDAIWTGVSPLQPTLKETGSGRYYTCDSDHVANMPMTAISLLYKTILLLTACSLAFLTRNVDMLYGESKAIGVSSYAMLLSGGIIIPLVFLPQTDAQTAFYLKSTGILVSGLVTTFALFWPKLYLTVLNETGIDSFLRSGTRRSSRSRKGKTTAVSSGGGGSSGGNQDTMMAQSMQARTEEQAKEDDRIVKTPNVCTLYQKGGMNGRLRKCEVVMDPAQGIILFAVMSENSQLNFPGVSFRLEHLSSCSWDPQEHSLILQAGDNSLQVTFQSTRILQAYVNEMSAKLVGKDATVSTPASFMSAFRTSRIG
ncbi:7 transmembrane sweet-taste receptor of 3 GCPR-domain-containing protein [Phlyctochytrium arcticum]|nr:7 transmembrane sweet-taste receptor of 3 GCPR-domain-containing protein [Phlyctochytrium arcticum]